MAKSVTLKDNNAEALYPVTKTTNVYDENNKTVEEKLAEIEAAIPDTTNFVKTISLTETFDANELTSGLYVIRTTAGTNMPVSNMGGQMYVDRDPSNLNRGSQIFISNDKKLFYRVMSPNTDAWGEWSQIPDCDAENTFNGVNNFKTILNLYKSTHVRHSITKGTVPSTMQYREIIFRDSKESIATVDNLGIVGNSIDTNGIMNTYIRGYSNKSEDTASKWIGLIGDTNGTIKTYAPHPTSTVVRDNQIATTAWAVNRHTINYSGTVQTVNMTAAQSYTIPTPQDGWVTVNIEGNAYTQVVVTIGNYTATIGINRDDAHGRWFGMPVKAGTVVTCAVSGNTHKAVGKFIPFL